MRLPPGSVHIALIALTVGLASLALEPLRADAPSPPHYLTLAANPDLVMCGPYDTVQAGPANWGTGVAGGAHSREFITLGNRYRIRQSGLVPRIRLNLQDASGLTGFYLRIWRRIGGTYDMVGSSENLGPAMSVGPNTLDLKRPIAVQERDYYGYRIESTAAANFYARTKVYGVQSAFVTDATPGFTDNSWRSASRTNGAVLPIELYQRAPLLVGIGNSIMEGVPSQWSFLEDDPTPGMGTSLLDYLGEQWRVTRQNMGISGQTTSQIAARFTTDVVNLRPRLVVIQGGGSDLQNSGVSLELFLSNWKKMLDACQANGIKPIVMLVPPGRGFSAAQSQKRDLWNAALRTLATGYPGAVVIDLGSTIGANRPSGPSNNVWDIAKPYDADGNHFKPAGYQRIAQAIVEQYTEP